MSSRFERAYRVDGTDKFNAAFWNRIMRDLDTRIVGVEEKKADFEEAEKTLLDLGLRRINETLLPAAERIFRVAELGFLVASSDEEATLVQGQNASLIVRAGDQRDLFTPSPFIALTRRSTTDDYAIARTIAYDPETGVLLFEVETVVGNGGPHSDWDVAALAGSVAAMVAALEETREIADQVSEDAGQVAADKATAISAKDDAVLAKADAEAALSSFLTVYRGALSSAPGDGQQGHFYFDTTLQQARVYTAAGWAPLFSIALGGIRQDVITAEDSQTVFTVDGGGFTFINVWKNGALLTPGEDYTTASPDFTLAAAASEGDKIAYTAYYATDQSDFYTKEAADGRFAPISHTHSAGQISGLGDAATKNVGTTAGTVAAGDDSRITGAVQQSLLTQEGDIPVRGSSGWERLQKGDAGDVLTVGTTGPQYRKRNRTWHKTVTTSYSTSSGSFQSASGFDLTVTPSDATKAIRIEVNLYVGMSGSNDQAGIEVQLRRGTTVLDTKLFGFAEGYVGWMWGSLKLEAIDQPATTNPVSYNIRFRRERGNDVIINEDGVGSSITATEVILA